MIYIQINGKIVGIYEEQMLQTTEKLFSALKLHIGENWKIILIKKGVFCDEIKTN